MVHVEVILTPWYYLGNEIVFVFYKLVLGYFWYKTQSQNNCKHILTFVKLLLTLSKVMNGEKHKAQTYKAAKRSFKERQNKLHRSSVVYHITCSCKSMYIGQTSRNLITRVKNHDPNSPNRQDTDVSKHLRLSLNPDHKIDFDKTDIMAQTNHWRKLLITETLLIQKHNPNLRVDRTFILLYLFNT